MSTTSVYTVSDLATPEHGWAAKPVGPFVLHWWTGSGPPRWKVGSTGHYENDYGHARAFMGGDAAVRSIVERALRQVARYLAGIGISVDKGDTVDVLLWDEAFPLPPLVEFQGITRLDSPVTFSRRKPFTIVLPTYNHGLRGAAFKQWLRTSAIHEGLHGILWTWLCVTEAHKELEPKNWEKFEEMCAVALEYKMAGRTTAWMDFGHAWQGSLALSHYRWDWPVYIADWASSAGVNLEKYGHFPLLAWLEEVIWPEHERAGRLDAAGVG